jgi:hypothetical protein
LLKNTSWKELRDFAFQDVKNPEKTMKWSQPFIHDIPSFPLRQRSKRERIGTNCKHSDPDVPDHCPPYPPSHTYSRSFQKSKTSSSEKSARDSRVAALRAAQSCLAKIEDHMDNEDVPTTRINEDQAIVQRSKRERSA